MLIRAKEERDRISVDTINALAFGRPAEANLVVTLREQAEPVVSPVAEADGAVVGHIMSSPVSLTGHPNRHGHVPCRVSQRIASKTRAQFRL